MKLFCTTVKSTTTWPPTQRVLSYLGYLPVPVDVKSSSLFKIPRHSKMVMGSKLSGWELVSYTYERLFLFLELFCRT